MNSDTPFAAVGGGEQRAKDLEISIKSSFRRKDFRIDPGQLLAMLPEIGLLELPITAVHAAGVTRFPLIHRYPFRPSVDCAES